MHAVISILLVVTILQYSLSIDITFQWVSPTTHVVGMVTSHVQIVNTGLHNLLHTYWNTLCSVLVLHRCTNYDFKYY